MPIAVTLPSACRILRLRRILITPRSATGIKTSMLSARLPVVQMSESDLGGPAVDEELGAGDETGIIRSEEGDGFRGFLRAAHAAHGCG